jgi:hypothetical protein
MPNRGSAADNDYGLARPTPGLAVTRAASPDVRVNTNSPLFPRTLVIDHPHVEPHDDCARVIGRRTIYRGTEHLYLMGATVVVVAVLKAQPRGDRIHLGTEADQDGDIDFTCGNHTTLHNLSAQVVAAAAPRIGQPYVADLYGQANGVGILGVSLGTLLAPLPPYGNLQVDPGSLFLWPAVSALDGNGHGTLTIPVPAASGLVGLRLFLQGLVTARPYGALRFTNGLGERIGL